MLWNFFIILTILCLLAITIVVINAIRKEIIYEHQRGLLYRNGKFVRILEPGLHHYNLWSYTCSKVDVRIQNVTIASQEVLSADNVSIKMSLAASYKVSDPYLAINKIANYQEALYLILQLNLRDVIGSLPIETLLAKRAEISKTLFDNSLEQAAEIGLQLIAVNIKDIMFPGELKTIFAQVVNARHEGLAALERARGESAALRNLANAAKLLDNNPSLLQLRLFQVLENSSGNTVVLTPPDGTVNLREVTQKH
jgi:regulator of protease activity HflC (stomatin/prohibitin superfamily)